jgi:hypothetical protein
MIVVLLVDLHAHMAELSEILHKHLLQMPVSQDPTSAGDEGPPFRSDFWVQSLLTFLMFWNCIEPTLSAPTMKALS